MNNQHELKNLYNRPYNYRTVVEPHRDELLQHIDTTAESLLNMLSKQTKLSDIAEHSRAGVHSGVEKLIKSVLTYNDLTPSMVKTVQSVIEKLVAEGNTYMVRWEIGSMITLLIDVQYKDRPEVKDALVELKDWMDKKFAAMFGR